MPETLSTVHIPVGELRPNTWNPNRQTEHIARAEAESIRTFGFIDPITARPHPDGTGFEIIDGEHRWREAERQELPDVPVVVLDVSDSQARKLTIVLNETRGDADVVEMGRLLAALKLMADDDDEFLVALPFTDGDLQHMLALADENWDSYAGGSLPDGQTADADGSVTVTLRFQNVREHRAFERLVTKGRRAGLGEEDQEIIVALCQLAVDGL